jgi:hypothetical protein
MTTNTDALTAARSMLARWPILRLAGDADLRATAQEFAHCYPCTAEELGDAMIRLRDHLRNS